MNPFLQQLLDFLNSFAPAPGTPPEATSNLLRALAATLILQDPANASVVPPAGTDPRIAEAIQAGAVQAASLTAAGRHLRLEAESVPFNRPFSAFPERRSERFGPFAATSGQLLRFASIERPAFIAVTLRLPPGQPQHTFLELLIPAGTTPSPDRRVWQLPVGTVWIQARFFVANAQNFVGVRITGGTLTFTQTPIPGSIIDISPGTGWTLSLDLEQPAPAVPTASDADALQLGLPTQLNVGTGPTPTLSGDITLSGFGSDLRFTPAGAPFVDGNQMSFPLQTSDPSWSIAGNLSPVTQFSGAVTVTNPRFALPMTGTPAASIGEASHAGTVVVSLGDGLSSTLTGQQGDPCRWFVATLACNAEQIEVQSLQPACGASFDLALWNTSLTRLRFAAQPISRLGFRSERGGFDEVSISGGACTNQWDLPRRADGKPFDFAGAIDAFGLYTSPTGVSLTVQATAPTAPSFDDFTGFSLENLYLLVRPLRRLALNAAFDAAPSIPFGEAILFFDVGLAVPMLPDPYATNIVNSRQDTAASRALRVDMAWADSLSPTLSAHLDSPVRFPAPLVPLLDDPDESRVRGAFQAHLQSQPESLLLLDLSTREHLFGVAIEAPGANQPQILDNLLTFPLSQVRLLMQPQVQWEPVQLEPPPGIDPDPAHPLAFAHSRFNGGPTLVGTNSVTLVPSLPTTLSDQLLQAIGQSHPAGALFSLPFGLRAFAQLDHVPLAHLPPPILPPATETSIHEPSFEQLTSVRQIRLLARSRSFSKEDPSRLMPGVVRQLSNFTVPTPDGSTSVIPHDLVQTFNDFFLSHGGIPLHRADLSGYGLSTFSQWQQDAEALFGAPAVAKVEFQVLNGRTAYEVIQFRSILFESGARVIRTIFLERHNAGRVFRIDTGWVAIDDGEFKRPDAFQTGAVRAFRNIRRIRVVGPVINLDAFTTVEPVIFDADADIDGAIGGSFVPIYDRPGYVQLTPTEINSPAVVVPPLEQTRRLTLQLLFKKVGPIGGPIDCAVRVASTLEAQISSIVSDIALDDAKNLGFAVAIVGSPKLPRAGQWTFVRLDAFTHEPAAVDAHRGVPLVRNGSGAFKFREPADTRLNAPRIEYALLMATDTSRVLFKAARVDPAQSGKLLFDLPPLFADPHSLVQSTGLFPRPNFALPLTQIPAFTISPEDLWKIDRDTFDLNPALKPLNTFMQGSGWGITRDYDLDPNQPLPNPNQIVLAIDSALPAPFKVQVPPSLLNLQLPDPLGQVLQIKSQYAAAAGDLSKLADPTLVFSGALQQLTDIVNSLSNLVGLPFHFDVSITAGSGASPSFVVHMGLVFRVGDGPDGRIELGLGKFYGQFTIKGELQAALTGIERALLFMEFQGDVQQGIFPPLLYAGGLFRFSVELHETGGPLIQLTLGIVISIGGDLIPGLLAVEGTIKYGYSLVPETLQPGVLIGIEARAKLLAGLIGFSFSAEVLAKMLRVDGNPLLVTIFAQIRIAASVHIAIFLDEDIDFQTQFHQDIPVAAFAFVPGAAPFVLAAEAGV